MKNILDKSITYSRMIKLSHTIFALPFALASVILASREQAITLPMLGWIIVAMTAARSAAMGFNRLADAKIDAANPRTAMREIPAGKISNTEAAAFISISSIIFIIAAGMLSKLCLWLSVPCLILLFIYSLTKRFTWLAHIYLGFAIGMVPAATWIAITGTLTFEIILLCLTLLTYIAGFDILYACQDQEFDHEEDLHSIPSRFGAKKAFAISTALHIMSVGLLLSLFWAYDLNWAYLIFVAIIAVLFIIEHRLVNPDDLSKINIAFFNVNSAISVMVLLAIMAGVWSPL